MTLKSLTPQERWIACAIAGLLVLRFAAAAAVPLAFDEAYYWLWSQHLAPSYFDHPPAVAYLIALGTAIFGDSEFGVRAGSVLLSAASAFAVWRGAALLLRDREAGALAALFFSLTLMVAAETVFVTPESPLIAAAAFLLYFLALVRETGRGTWWLAAGAAAGIGLLSKYTALFFAPGVLLWLLFSPDDRRWLRTAWPYLGAVVAAALFAPVLLWNAEHGWISFAKQLGRVSAGSFTLRYFGEFILGQIGLATPFIFVLGAFGLSAMVRERAKDRSTMVLLFALIAPPLLYFLWHSLHDRVQGNWPSFVYPAFAIAAAAAARRTDWPALAGKIVRASRLLAAPVAAILTLLLYVQAAFDIVPLGRSDPAGRVLAADFTPLARDIDRLRVASDAKAVLTTSYALTGWLAFYLPAHPPVIQVDERYRWSFAPEPARETFDGPLLYVVESWRDKSALVAQHFARVEKIAQLARAQGGVTIEEYEVYRVAGLRGDPYDRAPPGGRR